MKNDIKSNNKFSSSVGFIAAASGAAIGLSNIWKFPYEVGIHGGALYIIIYILFTIILGYPLLIVKSLFGNITKRGVYGCYSQNKNWRFLGLFAIIICISVLSFYNVVTGWILGYAHMTLSKILFTSQNYEILFSKFIKNIPKNLIYHLIITIIVISIVKKGIKSGIEKFSKILMPILIFLLIFLTVYSFTLRGSIEGLKFYLFPSFQNFKIKSIISALSHSFLSLALGGGVMITYGAYAKNVNFVKDSFIIVISDFIIAFLAGLMIFPLVFHVGIKTNEGPSLIFISIPYVLKALGFYRGMFIGTLFFTLLIFAAITSAISMLEIPIKYFMEKFNVSRNKVIYYIGIAAYLLGIPSLLSNGSLNFFTNFINFNGNSYSFMDLIIIIIVEFLMPLNVLLFSIFISKKWNEYFMNQKLKLFIENELFIKYVHFIIKYIAPIFIFTIIMMNFLKFLKLF